jgi:putative transcriptional regulator
MKSVLKPANKRLERLVLKDLDASLRGEPSSYTRLDLPKPASITEVKAARRLVHRTQRQFAQALGVSLETVKAWESGKRVPEGVATKVIRLLKKRPSLVGELGEL